MLIYRSHLVENSAVSIRQAGDFGVLHGCDNLLHGAVPDNCPGQPAWHMRADLKHWEYAGSVDANPSKFHLGDKSQSSSLTGLKKLVTDAT